ncbi:DUF5994 family protein [Amycolatopsis sp. NPDC054798]
MIPRPRVPAVFPPAIARLRLKPPRSASGSVDGAWWPRSGDLAAEVPGLAAALADAIGPLWRVAFPLSAWAATSRRMIFQGRMVRLEGFRSQNPHLVHATGGNMRRVTLLVVPPQTAAAAAGRALAAAADQNNEARPETILDESAVLPRRWLPAPREGELARWESEGGGAGRRPGAVADGASGPR